MTPYITHNLTYFAVWLVEVKIISLNVTNSLQDRTHDQKIMGFIPANAVCFDAI